MIAFLAGFLLSRFKLKMGIFLKSYIELKPSRRSFEQIQKQISCQPGHVLSKVKRNKLVDNITREKKILLINSLFSPA